MAAGIAHELNNPLTTVAGFAELILGEVPDEFEQRPDLELILREAIRARGVVRRLLDFSRQSESVRERANINEIVDDVITLVHHLARTSGVEIKSNFNENIPLIYVDSNQMKQVLLNFVHNGLQAMPTGGEMTLETKNETKNNRSWVTIRIQDAGEGIPKENLDRIFEPFFTTKPTGSGTGLGLSISYGIISDHGGFIEVDSKVGQGTCFKLWLPEKVANNHG
jgi:signal transduction histidine kinase